MPGPVYVPMAQSGKKAVCCHKQVKRGAEILRHSQAAIPPGEVAGVSHCRGHQKGAGEVVKEHRANAAA